ncbi:MAG: sugar phosphate nucleotidyltransferase [Cyanobacteria bacterium P01_F01_bin.86]
MSKKRAIILAGGKGTRLRPYTLVLPKPLMPIGDYPILELVVRQLTAHGFDHITMAVNHQAELIKAFFGDGSKWSVKIDYSMEDRPLSTMGPLKLIKDLPDNFLVMNGDILTDLDYQVFYDTHSKNQRNFTISAHSRIQKIDYGVLESNDRSELIKFREKPETLYQVSMGIYMLNKSVLDYIPEDSAFGFDDLMLKLLEHSVPVKVEPFSGYWLDIGRPDDYMQATEEFDDMRSRFIDD